MGTGQRRRSDRGRGRRLLLSLSVVGAAAAIAGLGTYASFTSTTQATQTVASGTVVIALGAPGPANRLNVGASGLVAGDTVQRVADLANTGSQNLSSVTLSTVATASSALDTDATNGLQMVIDACSVAWTEGGTAPAYTYTCTGTTSLVVAATPVIGTGLALSNLGSLTAGVTDHLRITLTLPATAGTTLQGQSSTIQYTFTGTQRAATSQ
ncbi:MAG TPA: TasA family protein [Actinomycetota bacterium]|nr:TasA family protein [Actinomycetota bacterium]